MFSSINDLLTALILLFGYFLWKTLHFPIKVHLYPMGISKYMFQLLWQLFSERCGMHLYLTLPSHRKWTLELLLVHVNVERLIFQWLYISVYKTSLLNVNFIYLSRSDSRKLLLWFETFDYVFCNMMFSLIVSFLNSKHYFNDQVYCTLSSSSPRI